MAQWPPSSTAQIPLLKALSIAHASKDSGKGKIVGSSQLATNVVGASHWPVGLACGNATPPNSELSGGETPDPEVKIRKRRYLTRGYKLGVLKQVDKLRLSIRKRSLTQLFFI